MENTEENRPNGENSANGEEKRLSPDILWKIFLLLPLRSLETCQFVCKWWRYLISDPCFVRNFRLKYKSLLAFYHCNYGSESISYFPVSENPNGTNPVEQSLIRKIFTPNGHSVTHLSSCNGLFLSHIYKTSPPNAGKSGYIVSSPLTQKNVRLPPPPTLADEPRFFLVHGFAFDTSGRTPWFKVIRVLRSGKQVLVVSTFSSETVRWKSVKHDGSFLNQWQEELSGVGTMCNGSLHWLCLPLGIVAYNIRGEQFSLIRIPEEEGRLLGETEGQLLYVTRKTGYALCIWALDDCKQVDWHPRYWIDVRYLPMGVSRQDRSDLFSVIFAFDRRDSRVMFLRLGRRVYSYHLQTGEAQKLYDFGEDKSTLEFFCPYELPNLPDHEGHLKLFSARKWGRSLIG